MTLEELDGRLSELRPRLHRYCARMTGSIFDGEDVVQDSFAKATASLAQGETLQSLESWIFRVAHNIAIDFLRKRTKLESLLSDEDPALLSETENPTEDRDIVAASLTTFMRIPITQRSAVILKDVSSAIASPRCRP